MVENHGVRVLLTNFDFAETWIPFLKILGDDNLATIHPPLPPLSQDGTLDITFLQANIF